MALFFTQTALLTFGGAYAVMPYVFEHAVQTHHWISATQMLDGLAMGESTPGPLIIVVAFIGYLAGAGADHAAWPGVAGAMVATFFTFLPSFLFILLGAPWVERSRHLQALMAPLAAVTAVVVGAILHLALTLGTAVLWPQGQLEFDALLLMSLALLTLLRGWLGIVPVILLSAVFGGVLQFL
jgi:chromate transporter